MTKRFISDLVIFFCGGVFLVNLGVLLKLSDNYQANWINVVLFPGLAILLSRSQ